MHNAEMGLSDISECEWPCFLYPRGTKYDIKDDRDGLFRGYLLPMVCLTMLIYADFIHFFVGLSSDLYWPKDGNAARSWEKGSCK